MNQSKRKANKCKCAWHKARENAREKVQKLILFKIQVKTAVSTKYNEMSQVHFRATIK